MNPTERNLRVMKAAGRLLGALKGLSSLFGDGSTIPEVIEARAVIAEADPEAAAEAATRQRIREVLAAYRSGGLERVEALLDDETAAIRPRTEGGS